MQMSDGCVDFNACGFHALAAADSDVAPSVAVAVAADDEVAAGRWGSVLPEPNNCSTAKVNWATHATSHTHTQHSTPHRTQKH